MNRSSALVTVKQFVKSNIIGIVITLLTYLLMFAVDMLLLVLFILRLAMGQYLAQFFAVAVVATGSFAFQKFFIFRGR